MALITTTEQLRKYLPVAYANLNAQLPHFEEAETKYLVPILGEGLYATINTNISSTEDKWVKLLACCRAVVAPMAYLINIPFLQGLITDNGILVNDTQNARKAFKWEYNEVVNALQEKGYAAMEQLIMFLSLHASDYTDWNSSPYNDVSNFGLIRNGFELQISYPTAMQPHRMYMLLKPLFFEVAELFIKESISTEFYNALNARLIARTMTDNDKKIIPVLRHAAARMVMNKAAITMSVQFGEGGFTITDASGMKDNRNEGKSDAGDARLLRFADENLSSAQKLMSNVVKLLNGLASQSIFPEYYSSNKYVDPNAPKVAPRNNENRRVFGM